KARGFNESSQLNLDDLLVLERRASQGHRHRTVATDRDRQGVVGNIDGRLHRVAAGRHDLAVLIDLQAAVTRVAKGAVGQLDFQKALALNGNIQAVAGVLQVALSVNAFGGNRAHTGTDLQTRGQLVGRTHLGAGLTQVLIHQLFEHGASALEAGGTDVGQVVRDHIEVQLLRFEAGLAYPE